MESNPSHPPPPPPPPPAVVTGGGPVGTGYSSQSSLTGGATNTRTAELDEIIRESDKTTNALNVLEHEIWKAEDDYFDATAHGNIVRGWDGFLDSKPPPKRMYHDKERVFSWSSYTYWSRNRQQIQNAQMQESEEAKRNRSFNVSPREHKAFLKKRKRKRSMGADVSDDEE